MTDAITARYPALGFPLYRRYFFASFASVGATQFATLAQGWLVFELSGSALDLGLLGAAAALPNIVVSLFGGVVADRFDKRRIILVASALTAALLLLLALLDVLGLAAVWHIWLVAGLVSVITGIEWPTRQAIFPHLIEREALLSAVALNAFIWQSTRMVMPAIGGALIAATNTASVFFLASLGYLVMCLVMLTLRVDLPRHDHAGSALDQIREGVHFIWTNELFRWLIALSFAGMFFANAYVQIMPAFAVMLGAGESGYGALLSAGGLGSVVGTLLAGMAQRSWPPGVVLLTAAALSGICLYPFALAVALGWYPLAMGAVFAVALASSIFMISSMTALQLAVPDALRGRVMGIHSVTYSLVPLGGLLMGAIADRASEATAVVLGATVFIVCVLSVAWTRPAIRQLVAESR
jgi:MFS family permease